MQVAPIASEPLACQHQQVGATCWRFLSLGGSDEWVEVDAGASSANDEESLENVTSLGGSNKGALRLVKRAALS